MENKRREKEGIGGDSGVHAFLLAGHLLEGLGETGELWGG